MSPVVTVRVSDAAGNETVATHSFQAGGETILTGDIGGVVAAGTTARLRGNCRLTADLHVRGTLVADPTGVDLDGQSLFDIHTHDGGILDLQGTPKTGWVRWGEPVVGWDLGDRLVIAPTNGYVPTVLTWQGSWASTTRPANSQPVVLPNGQTIQPEVGNLTRSLKIRNVTRMMMHESPVPNVHTLKHFSMVNCGKLELAFYPVHFHFLADTCRGSLVEGVVVEGSKLRAFVPHASHGITFRDCIAFNIVHDAFWWDQPPAGDPLNDTHDTLWEHCLAIGITTPSTAPRQSTFLMGQGNGNRCIDCAAVANQNTKDAAGFTWPENGVGVWEFRDCVAHNNQGDGIFVWQNDDHAHVITDFIGYRNKRSQVDHGAYTNRYRYENLVLAGPDLEGNFKHHARPVTGFPILIENVTASGRLLIAPHQAAFAEWAIYRNAHFASVHYEETTDGGDKPSWIRFEDCGLTPANFVLIGIIPTSLIEIYEAGVLVHRWSGGWT